MSQDASKIFRAENGELERLSALETLKGLKSRDKVSLGELVRFLEARGLWPQFRKITLNDLREAFSEPVPLEVKPPTGTPSKRRKQRILEEEFSEIDREKLVKPLDDGGMTTDEVARSVLPFIEGNGEVTLEDIAEYSQLDRKVLRYHLGALVKQERLERIGVGRHALYSTL